MPNIMFTPPLTPASPFSQITSKSDPQPASGASTSRPIRYAFRPRNRSPGTSPTNSTYSDVEMSPDFALPPPMMNDADASMPPLALPEACGIPQGIEQRFEMYASNSNGGKAAILANRNSEDRYDWRPDMTAQERDDREAWLAGGRGRRGLRIVIVTENFLPKVDGVTRTLARLLEHLQREGHQCMLLGPGSGMTEYSGHPLVGTAGVPLVVYPGLKLNFLRPKFMRTIRDFQPDVVHFVDPIWLGAQTLMAMELGWAGEEWVGENGPALGGGITGAVVASYHTNLATYAKLFGWAWLEPIMWNFQRWLYSKTLITLCPSPSTLDILSSQSFTNPRLWPRGVDLSQFGPSKRSQQLRNSWNVGDLSALSTASCKAQIVKAQVADKRAEMDFGVHWNARKVSMPLTPPMSPAVMPALGGVSPVTQEPEPMQSEPAGLSARVVLLYVGRISWEKNLHLLLAAYGMLKPHLPIDAPMPKLVFVGDGPARIELEQICREKGFDAVFMGHRTGEDLARCYASADVFAFPSFTETFGQVVLEALASGLPVVGLDADGTRDLVSHTHTGLLLPIAQSADSVTPSWSTVCKSRNHPLFRHAAEAYAVLLARAVVDHAGRQRMSERACSEGIKGFTWWDAMERCVDGYRESLRIAREKRSIKVVIPSDNTSMTTASPSTPRLSRAYRVTRALSSRLAHRGSWMTEDERLRRAERAKLDLKEGVWHLKTVLKLLLAIWAFWAIYSRHLGAKMANVSVVQAGEVF